MTPNPTLTVRITPYTVELWRGEHVIELSADDAETLVVKLVAAIRTITQKRPVDTVVH